MKKFTLILVVILLGVAPVYATQVNTISLTHKANTTIATIHVDGQVRVTHQTEVPKDGRGHRVIVDLLAANHNLGTNLFDQLPNCQIESIRSSQFAVTPEAITRVVFDLKSQPLYRIETDLSSAEASLVTRQVSLQQVVNELQRLRGAVWSSVTDQP